MEELLGSYYPEQKTCRLSVNQSENISKKQIEKICSHILDEQILNLTLEFDDGNFIFFTNLKDKIRFVEGPKIDFVDLQQKAKNDLDGKIIRSENLVKTALPDILYSESVTPEVLLLDEKVLLQHSLFSSLDKFEETFAKAEIYFRPFEDPGGDFYWIKNYERHSLVVVGDCTGHGIQGAMISMSVMTILKQFFRSMPKSLEKSIYEFYTQLNELIEEGVLDTFDTELGFVFFNKDTQKISYIGSGVNLIVKTPHSINLHTSRKSKIVKRTQSIIEFLVTKGDQLFLFTDGISDQYDSSDDRKLGAKGLKKLLQQPEKITLNSFEKSFGDFKGETKPFDDQTILMLTI